MASVASIIHANSRTVPLTPGIIGVLCSHRLVAAEAYERPEAFAEYWTGTLLRHASQDNRIRDLWEFDQEILAFIGRLPNGLAFIASYERDGVLWSLDDGRWPCFNVFSAKNRLRILRRAVRLLWAECWEDWLFWIDPEGQSAIYEDSEWALRQGLPPIHTAHERQYTTAFRWILRYPYEAAEQIAEGAQRQRRKMLA